MWKKVKITAPYWAASRWGPPVSYYVSPESKCEYNFSTQTDQRRTRQGKGLKFISAHCPMPHPRISSILVFIFYLVLQFFHIESMRKYVHELNRTYNFLEFYSFRENILGDCNKFKHESAYLYEICRIADKILYTYGQENKMIIQHALFTLLVWKLNVSYFYFALMSNIPVCC